MIPIQKMIIEGGSEINGKVTISGSKNASLPILAATLLTNEKCIIHNIPNLSDVLTLIEILNELGVKIDYDRKEKVLVAQTKDEKNIKARYELVKKMRASICVLGPLLAKRKKAIVSLPGGCVIGVRPVDLHLKGLKSLGAKIVMEHGYINAVGDNLKGSEIFLGGPFGPTVLGTANVMMCAVLSKGVTIIENAACEPEIQDLANFLKSMGAKIEGAGTHKVIIEGVKELHGTEYTIIPDRIEAGTFMTIGAISKTKELEIENVIYEHLLCVIDKLKEIGVEIIKKSSNKIIIKNLNNNYSSTDIITMPYPGFPTDLQAQFTALLCLSDGLSVITEKVYPDRFMHIPELNRMGADIRKEGPSAIIRGVKELYGAPVMASDLRASAALVLAGLVAKGKTIIDRIYHLDRGYENLDKKLESIGAKVYRTY